MTRDLEMPKTVAMATARRPAVPLSQASTLLARICDAIDDGVPLTEVAKVEFAGLKAGLAASTDQHIAFKHACDGLIAGARMAEEAWRTKRKQIESVLDAFKAEVKATIQADPDVPYSGHLGTLKLGKNGGKPKLVTRFLVREDKVISNVIDPQVVDLFEIPPEFIDTVIVTRLNTDAVREALKSGSLSWAELERGCHVNGW